MKRNLLQLIVPVCGAMLALAACGERQNIAPANAFQQDMAALFSVDDAGSAIDSMIAADHDMGDPNGSDPNHDTCRKLLRQLKADFAELVKTPEFKKLTATPEWETLIGHMKEAKAAHCRFHDPNPSAECQQLKEQLKKDFEALKATTAFAECAATPQAQKVKTDLDNLKAAGCGHHH